MTGHKLKGISRADDFFQGASNPSKSQYLLKLNN